MADQKRSDQEAPALAEQVREALSHKPETYQWYSYAGPFDDPDEPVEVQRHETAAAVIPTLPAGAEAAALDILIRFMLEPPDLLPDDALRDLAYLTTDPPRGDTDLIEYKGISDDWLLHIFRGEHGALYRFAGWPGDNQVGGGVYYGRDGTAVDVFEIGDGSLTSRRKDFDGIVAAHALTRVEQEAAGTFQDDGDT